jgi:hypothetical protein
MSDDDAEDLSDDVELVEEVPQVAASEHDMIMMARALVAGQSGHDDIWSLLCATRALPPKIGPTSARLLEDTLRHAWRTLWLRGGAKPSASVKDGSAGSEIRRGRLWERHAPASLSFTAATVKLLRWLVATPFAAPASTLPELPAMPLAVGDQLMIYLALDAARSTPALRGIAIQPFVRAAPLAWLGFAPLLVGRSVNVPAFESLTAGSGAIVVEALQGELAKRWYTAELDKRAITDPQELIELGTAQEAVLAGFMGACDQRGRRDLAAFVIDAAIPLLAKNISPAPAELDPKSPLSVRAQARTAAGAMLRAVLRWQDWDQEHRGVRFIDDNYQAAQLLLERYEPIGAAGSGRISGWLADLASLAPTAPTPSDNISDQGATTT